MAADGGEHLVRDAMAELDRIDGTVVPEFVLVQDGWYDRRVVIDRLPSAKAMKAGDPLPEAGVIEWHYEPCHEPRFRTALRWVAGPAAGLYT